MSVLADEDTILQGGYSVEDLQRIVGALYRVHRLVAVLTDLEQLLSSISEESRHVARAEASSLMLFDPETEELYFRVALGESGDQEALKRGIRLKLGQGIAGMTAQSRSSIMVADVTKDPRFFPGVDSAIQFQTRNLLAVPMIDRDTLIGVLEVVNKIGEETFSPLDLRVMEMFSSIAASVVSNARLIEEHIRNERFAAIGQAITTLSHHTKNIVTGLSSSADLIDMGLQNGNIDILKRTWPVFKRSTKRVSNFVQDMLTFSKTRAPIREQCTAAFLIGEAQETFTELFARKNITLNVDTKQAAKPVWVDPEALYRCLINLLINAAEAVPEDNGCISITARTLENDTLEILVDDNGPGVPEAHWERIFDPFFSTKGSQGTGLGLAVTRKIAREHGGDITVGEAPKGGASFRMAIPAMAGPTKEVLGV
ncbi:MAG TPA: ATP-binding protein [Candidatus Hydrogenedentes bacterium]|nr:ATP-binding protein [Candidatus Hydrogenedentota bacterium]